MTGKTPEWMPELFFCHRYKFCLVAEELGFRLGTRSDQFDTNQTHRLLQDGYTVDFVDNNFKDPDRDRLEKVVEKTECSFVVLPDVYERRDFDDIRQYGLELAETYDVTPVVVPKTTLNEDEIPSDWIIGFSVPSGYGETDVPITTWKNHRIHLLGGSPRNQVKYANKVDTSSCTLFSVDGNAFSKAAGYGNIINEPIEILDENGTLDEKAWVKDVDGYTDWGQRIAQSLARYYELWRQWSLRRSDSWSNEEIVKKT